MASTTTSSNPHALPKSVLITAGLLKQIRATAALKCYDFVFEDSSMKLDVQQRKVYNYFHGNQDLNVISQIDLLMKGHGDYIRMFDEEVKIITDVKITPTISQRGINPETYHIKELILKNCFTSNLPHRFVSGQHFTKNTVSSPMKTKPDIKATGRHLIDIAKISIRNIKKAVIIAELWLSDGKLPSGKTWEDLYFHVLSTHDASTMKERMFIGFMGFVCFSKYNDGGKNHLATLSSSDEDNIGSDVTGKAGSRKKAKTSKDVIRSMSSSREKSLFTTRGLSMDQRMGIVELAQIEDQTWRDDVLCTIGHLSDKRTALLTERGQSIEMAKFTCPQFDQNNEFWKSVSKLSAEIDEVKKEIEITENRRDLLLKQPTQSKNLVSDFLQCISKLSTVECKKEIKKNPPIPLINIDQSDNNSTSSVGVPDFYPSTPVKQPAKASDNESADDDGSNNTSKRISK